MLESARQYWFWFINESNTDPDVLNNIAAALGWCPPHTRAFLKTAPARTANAVFGTITPAVRRTVLSSPHAVGECPACLQVERAGRSVVATIVYGMHDPKVRSRYSTHGGFCLPHASAALAETRPLEVGILLLDRLNARLRSTGELFSTLSKSDSDARPRAALRARFSDRLEREVSDESFPDVTNALRASFANNCCTACSASTRAETLLLTWIPRAWQADQETIEREYAETCAAHLTDLAAISQTTASAIAPGNAGRRRHEIETCRNALTLESDRRRHRRDAVQLACEPLIRKPPPCPVCKVAENSQARHLQLLGAALRDVPTRIAYEASVGICARHFLAMGADAADTFHQVLDARLALVSWEMTEASHKASWPRRFEPPTAEEHAWGRAPALLDGCVYLGNPPFEAGLAPLVRTETA